MAYATLSSVQTISTGQPFLAATLQQANDNDAFLASRPQCSVYNSAAQSISNDTATDLTADTENVDTDSMHSTASNTARITIQTAGVYLFLAQVVFAADADGRRALLFRVNNTTNYDVQAVPSVGALNSMAISGVRILDLSAGDYVTCRVLHTAGAALNATLSEFAAYNIGL